MSSLAFLEQASSQEDMQMENSQQQHRCRPALRLAKSASLVAVGVATGVGCFAVSEQGRFRAPVKPIARTPLDKLTELPAELPKFPVAFPIPPNNECGAAICAEGDLCCPGGPGYGYSCGTSQAVCCQGFLENDDGSPSQVSVAIVCGEKDVCCRNDDSNPYCCASGNQCKNNVCVASEGQCFPGDAAVQVRGGGRLSLSSLREGDEVLVSDTLGNLHYEPVVQFLHEDDTSNAAYVTIVHEHGEFRASDSHMAIVNDAYGVLRDLPAAQIKAGDELQVAGLDGMMMSRVLAIRRSSNDSGMYAPLTPSGQVVVDDVVASCYARPSTGLAIPHGAMHAVMYFVRALRGPTAATIGRSLRPTRAALRRGLPTVGLLSSSAN
eukprot:TRINITY_DN3067_c0_g1_i3.p2 TRINITY_DN3067_c0_g1~~TRINITY_DN3067_c0_g1_i3.p2  ORF type:complete len:380 (-),score=50.52 TRINITY_DN3067_c0_g1_i3:257-1396(-)